MPPDSVKYFRYERGYDMPPTMIERRDYENSTKGCVKGIIQCDHDYKKILKHTRSQFKNGNPQYVDSNGKMTRPSPCKICAMARDFSKTCEVQYENQFYGYAKESESGRNVYFHWSNNWHPNCGTSKNIKDGRLVPKGVPDRQSYDDLFKLSVKPDNQKVKTPKPDEFISGYIEENKVGPYRGRLQWTKWFRHSLTFVNWTKITKSAIENKGMQALVNQPKMLIARMIYDQNKLIPEMENSPKTPCNCEPISHEHWILAAITMVAFLGIRPKKRNILDQYGGISKVGEMDYFTFLEHIDKPNDLIRLTTLPCEEEPVIPLRMHPVDFSQTIHDDSFWSAVSDTFKSMPFAKRAEKPIGQWKKRQIDYGYYKDNQSIEHLPYHNPAPYYNSVHGYDPARYFPQMHAPTRHYDQYENQYDMRHVYHVPMVAMPPILPMQHLMHQTYPDPPVEHLIHSFDSASGSRKRSNSTMSDMSEYSMLDQGLQHLRHANRNTTKVARTSRDTSPRERSRGSRRSEHSEYSGYSAKELRDMIMEDVRRENEEREREKREREERAEREKRERRERNRRKRRESSDEERCREDSGREDNGRRSLSVESVASTDSFEPPPRYPTYDELLQQIKDMEKEKEEQMQIVEAIDRRQSESMRRTSRWKTESSDSDDF